MACETIRQYTTTEEVAVRTGKQISQDTINQAEREIDDAIACFYGSVFAKSFQNKYVYSAVLTTTTATISNLNYNTGYLQFTVIEILDGANKGKIIPISTNSGNVLTFLNTQTGLSGTVAVALYQAGKFPMYRDMQSLNSNYYKTIPDWLKEAVALQSQFIFENKQNDIPYIQAGESVDETNYTTNFLSSNGKIARKSIKDWLHPRALAILDGQNLTATGLD